MVLSKDLDLGNVLLNISHIKASTRSIVLFIVCFSCGFTFDEKKRFCSSFIRPFCLMDRISTCLYRRQKCLDFFLYSFLNLCKIFLFVKIKQKGTHKALFLSSLIIIYHSYFRGHNTVKFIKVLFLSIHCIYEM